MDNGYKNPIETPFQNKPCQNCQDCQNLSYSLFAAYPIIYSGLTILKFNFLNLVIYNGSMFIFIYVNFLLILKIQIICMQQYKLAIENILSKYKAKQLLASDYDILFNTLKSNIQQISKQESKNIAKSMFNTLLFKVSKINDQNFYCFLKNTFELLYSKKSSMILIAYQILPTILTKFIQGVQVKIKYLEDCIRIIYNMEFVIFNKALIEKELMVNRGGQIGNLYKQHFKQSIRTSVPLDRLAQIKQKDEISNVNRSQIKSVIFLIIFNNIEIMTEECLLSYLWMVYVYSGGTQSQDQNGISLYLLQKKNLFSIFKYYISIEQMSIMLLTLCEMSLQRKQNKFQILSAINMIHKKAANQSLFKLSEVAQSLVHLLQDQYADAFT